MSSVVNVIRNTVAENIGGVGHAAAPKENQFPISSVPDLAGKIAVITGATEGIGFAVSHTMLSRNIARIHMLSPSESVFDSAKSDVKSDLGEDYAQRITWHQVDMSDFKAVDAIGKKIAEQEQRLDIVVNNAGRGIMTFQIAESCGIDRHMAVNHFGHVVLTSALLPLLKHTAEAGHTVRIVNQASNAHQGAPSSVKFASVDELNTDLGAQGQYGRSKLANILYSRYLARHLTSPKILANATHPGFVDTTMSTRDIHEPYPIAGYSMSVFMKPLKKDQWEGAVSALYAATATENTGEYVCPPATPEPGTAMAQDEQLGEQLMKLTREILCEKMGVSKWEDC